MKKRHLKWIGAAAAICIVGLTLAGAADNSETGAVKNLLEKRTVVMENVLFGKITYDEGKSQLSQIEKDKLYNDDLEALSQYEDTDLEAVKKMEIKKLEKKSRIYDIMTFDCQIEWTISGMEKIYKEVYEYQVGVDVNGGDYRLVSFELQQ